MLRFGLSFPAFLLALLSSSASAQSPLFFEDFEGGGAGWTMTGTSPVLWHVSNNGECGSVGRMGAYNRWPTACDYKTVGPNSGVLKSPTFVLSGSPLFTVDLDFLLQKDSDDATELRVVDAAAPTTWTTIYDFNTNALTLTHSTLTIPSGSFWAGKTVYLEFRFFANSSGNLGFGWMVDNVSVQVDAVPPTITSIAPRFGPAIGGTTVTISGTSVVGVTSVTFGGVPGSNLALLSGTTLEVDTPAGLGTVDVVASNSSGSDTLVDGWTYVPAGAFVSLGPSGIPGQFGEPSFTGSGDLTPGLPPGFTLSLTGAQPFDLAYFFLSVEPTTPYFPFYGGTFYPLPILYQDVFGTDGSGSLALPVILPASVPSGTQLVLQLFFVDPFAIFGISGSNGLRADVP